MTQIRLLIDGAEFNLRNVSVLGIPDYESSLTVDVGGYSSGIVKGSGYNKAGRDLTIKYIINSWEYEILRDIQAQIASYFVWSQRRTYVLQKLYNGIWYSLRLTAPKYKTQDIVTLRRNEVSITLTALDNFWRAALELSVPFTPINGENPALTFDSIIEVPLRLEAEVEVPLQNSDAPFYLIFGEYGGKFLNINALLPRQYAGTNVLVLDDQRGRLSDYDLTPKMFGSLPMVSGNMITQYKSNLYVKNIRLYYTPGIY